MFPPAVNRCTCPLPSAQSRSSAWGGQRWRHHSPPHQSRPRAISKGSPAATALLTVFRAHVQQVERWWGGEDSRVGRVVRATLPGRGAFRGVEGRNKMGGAGPCRGRAGHRRGANLVGGGVVVAPTNAAGAGVRPDKSRVESRRRGRIKTRGACRGDGAPQAHVSVRPLLWRGGRAVRGVRFGRLGLAFGQPWAGQT